MAQKRVNKNLVVSLTLFSFVMLIVLSALVLRRIQQGDPKYFVERARSYEAREEWKAAALFYRKAWLRGQDNTHLVSYGDMLIQDGEVAKAVASWDQALINEPTLTSAHLKKLDTLGQMARLYLRLRNWRQVHEAAEAFLASDAERSSSQEAVARNLNGLALVSLARQDEGNLASGEKELRSAVELAPDVVDFALELAEHVIRQDHADEAREILEALMASHTSPGTEASKVRVAYATFLASNRETTEAKRYYTEAMTLAHEEPSALRDAGVAYAGFLTQQWAQARRDDPETPATDELFRQAESILKEAIERDPDDYEPYLQLATLYKLARRYADCVDVCAARLARGLSRTGIEGERDRNHAARLMIDASQAFVARAMTESEEDQSLLREEWLAKAREYVSDAQGEFPSSPEVRLQAGRVKLARGLNREALEDLRAADEGFRAFGRISWTNKLILAQTHLALSEAGAALLVLEEVVKEAERTLPESHTFWTFYAQTLFEANHISRAELVNHQILFADPGNTSGLRLKAAILERQGRGADAARVFEAATGDHVIAALLSARERVADGDMEGAVTLLTGLLADYPADPRLVGAVIQQLLALDRHDEARDIADRALAEDPANTRLKALRVVTRDELSADQRDEAMLEIIATLEDSYQRTLELIGFYLRKEEHDRTLALVDQALEHIVARNTPGARKAAIAQHRTLLTIKLSVAAAVADDYAMASARDAAATFNVDGAGGKTLLGLYHLHKKEHDLAIKAFREATEVQPTDARSLMHLGQCLQLAGRIDEAQAAYQRAVRVNPNEGRAHKGLAMLARARGDDAAFVEALIACERLIPSDPWVAARVGERGEQTDPLAAIAGREARLADNPDDTQNLQRLVSLCEIVKDFDKADQYLGRLLDLKPGDKDLVVAAEAYFRRTDRPDRSLEAIDRYGAAQSTPQDEANARILRASHHMHQGDFDRAERELIEGAKLAETLEVLQSLAEFYRSARDRPEEALPWLDKAVEKARATDSPLLSRTMESRISCLLHRRINDVATARRYVDELLRTFPNNVRGQLFDSEVRARAGEIEEAVSALTTYLGLRPDNAFALYQRALHHRTLGQITAAITDLETLARSHPAALELRPRLLLARLYRQVGRDDLWLAELESLVADTKSAPRALAELVDAYVAIDRLADAERIVTTQINRSVTAPDSRWFVLRTKLALRAGNNNQAAADARRAAEISNHTPEAVARVLSVLLQVDRAAEGIEYYERHGPAAPPSVTLLSRYGAVLARAGRRPQAVEQFRHAMQLSFDGAVQARRAIAADLTTAFDTNTEIDQVIALVQEGPADGVGGLATDGLLAALQRMAGRTSEATAALNRLIQRVQDPAQRAGLLHELGDVHQQAGDADQARQAYEEALKYDGDNWVTLNNLAYLLADQLGDPDAAQRYAKRAVAKVETADTLDTLGWIHVGMGKHREAIAELSRAVRLEPGKALLHLHLAEAYRGNGRLREAREILEGGRDIARSVPDDAMVARFDDALQRLSDSVTSP